MVLRVLFVHEGKWSACRLGFIKWIDISELRIPCPAFCQVPTALCSNDWTADCSWYVSGFLVWSLYNYNTKGCLQLLEISWNLIDVPGKLLVVAMWCIALTNAYVFLFSCCSSFIKLVGSLGWHTDERWPGLIISYSFTDFKVQTSYMHLILYGLSHHCTCNTNQSQRTFISTGT